MKHGSSVFEPCDHKRRPNPIIMAYILFKAYWSHLLAKLECFCLNMITRIYAFFCDQTKPKNCLSCSSHHIVEDRNPFNPFRRKDRAILCRKLPPLPKRRFDHRIITCSCNLQEMRQECRTPEWCPLRSK